MWYIYVSSEKIHALVQEISYIQDFDLENRVKVSQTFNWNLVVHFGKLSYPKVCWLIICTIYSAVVYKV